MALALVVLAGGALLQAGVGSRTATGASVFAQPLRLVARGRQLLAQLEGSLAFNLGQASTTAKFKTVPNGGGDRGGGGGGGEGGAGGKETTAATPRDGNGGGGNNTCALSLSREQAGKLGQALLDASKSSGGSAVEVGGVAVKVAAAGGGAAGGEVKAAAAAGR